MSQQKQSPLPSLYSEDLNGKTIYFWMAIFTVYLHCLLKLYIFQINTTWLLWIKAVTPGKTVSRLVHCFFLCYLEALMQVSWERVLIPTDHKPHLYNYWNLEILSDYLIQVFHFTGRKQQVSSSPSHLPSPSRSQCSQLGQGPFLLVSSTRKQVAIPLVILNSKN